MGRVMCRKIGDALIQHPYVIIGLAPRAVKSRLSKKKKKINRKKTKIMLL